MFTMCNFYCPFAQLTFCVQYLYEECNIQPRHRGLWGQQLSANSKGEGSNPVANFFLLMQVREKGREREKMRKKNEFGNETKNEKKARPRTTIDARARSKSKSFKSKYDKDQSDWLIHYFFLLLFTTNTLCNLLF